MASLKDAGNALFAAGDVSAAVSKYIEALDVITTAPAGADDGTQALCASLHNNLAACYLRLEEPARALVHATEALSCDPTLVKVGVYRVLFA